MLEVLVVGLVAIIIMAWIKSHPRKMTPKEYAEKCGEEMASWTGR